MEAEPEIKLSEEEPAAEPVSPAEPISIDSEKSDDSIKPDLDSFCAFNGGAVED